MAEHRIPAVERAIDVLDAVSAGESTQIRDIAAALGIPRSTVYRILNSLEAHAMVHRAADGHYTLGPRLLRLARAVPVGADVVSIARPLMEELARMADCAVKLSVLDQGTALVVAVAESPGTYSVTTQVGRRFPLHAGAASKLLAAFADSEIQKTLLSGPLEAVTERTITSRSALQKELSSIRSSGVAEDHAEFAPGVFAIAAPVFEAGGTCVAALSVPYLESLSPSIGEQIRDGVTSTAQRISRQLGFQQIADRQAEV